MLFLALFKQIPILKIFILLLAVVLVFSTSGYQKYNQNALAQWPPGVSWTSMGELEGYLWLNTLPAGTKVFPFYRNDKFVIGFDKYSCSWCDNVASYREDMFNKSFDDLYFFLKEEQYEYFIISGMSYKYATTLIGENSTKIFFDDLFASFQNSSRFSMAHQSNGALIVKVN